MMKNFFYTVAGKTVLLILCTVLTIVSLLSLGVGVGCVALKTYSEEQAVVEKQVEDEWIKRMADICFQDAKVSKKKVVQVKANNSATLAMYAFSNKSGAYDELCVKTSDYQKKATADSIWCEGYVHVDGKTYALDGIDKDGDCTKKLDLVKKAFQYRYKTWGVFAFSVLLLIALFVTLLTVSGRRRPGGDLEPGVFTEWPADVIHAIVWVAFIGGIMGFQDMRYYGISDVEGKIAFTLFALAGGGWIATFYGLCMNLAVHLKAHNLLKTMFIYRIGAWCIRIIRRICHGVVSLFKTIPLVPKTVGVLGGITLLELIGISMFLYDEERLFSLWILEKCILLPFFVYLAVMLKRLHNGAKALAEGDLAETVNDKYMVDALKEHAMYLGSIAKGMNLAVQEQVKSERMKTELITNVSHDLKTPLTSIVNYSDLIGKEETNNDKIAEYSKILLKQSCKLKRLIEDLVEVSKATTGNLEVNLAPCNAAVFLEQANGEYQEKLDKAHLELIVEKPEMEVNVMADGRRMWRIFDNLMNNICKYAKEGTRVYLSLTKCGDEAVICFKNTSRAQLNISAEELMERFVRGEQSRTTEGNGLGLSIAQSLTELQNGKMKIAIDGDLFKVMITFPCQ
ncbi:MAG: HAMP domain-containing histidine kinase [Lachnospiraceae bacterium]|nr:HAMP domain-containing histidine kinase [Lachnospiraceae bacterium]